MKFSVFIPAGLVLIFASQALAQSIRDIAPPALVECQDQITCDRNPEHLEAFVSGFYRWYAANDAAFFSLAAQKLSQAERAGRIQRFSRNQKRVMQASLTPAFYHWTTIFTTDPPPTPDPRYCFDGGAILCFNGGNYDQIFKAMAKILSLDEKGAALAVSFPTLQGVLIVKLRVANGAWRIDGVTRSLN